MHGIFVEQHHMSRWNRELSSSFVIQFGIFFRYFGKSGGSVVIQVGARDAREVLCLSFVQVDISAEDVFAGFDGCRGISVPRFRGDGLVLMTYGESVGYKFQVFALKFGLE